MAKTTAACKDHKPHATREEARQAWIQLIADARKTGRGGKSWKRLMIFPCGTHFHVGRANQRHKPPKSTERREKQLTFGEARRKLAKLDRDLERTVDYCIRKRIEIATRLVELDRAAGWIV